MSVRSRSNLKRLPRRAGFTLVELLVTISIIAMLAGLLLGGLWAARETGFRTRSQSMIRRLDQAVVERFETYRTRRPPVDIRALAMARLVNAGVAQGPAYNLIYNGIGTPPAGQANTPQKYIAETRLFVMRELMRLELPQRLDDICQVNYSVTPSRATTTEPNTVFFGSSAALSGTYATIGLPAMPLPALSESYRRRLGQVLAASGVRASSDHQGAECLYQIVTGSLLDTDEMPLDLFRHLDFGDADNDGLPEFHDGWGHPIAWLRWPAGFHDFDPEPAVTTFDCPIPLEPKQDYRLSDFQPDPRKPDVVSFHDLHVDPMDYLRIDCPAAGGPPRGFTLHPLVYSPGADGEYDIVGWMALTNPNPSSAAQILANANQLNDPFYRNPGSGRMVGAPYDEYDPDGVLGNADDNYNVEQGLNFLDNLSNHLMAE